MVLPITVGKSYVAEKGKSTKAGSTGDTGDPRIETTRKAIPRWCYSSAQIGHPSKYLFWEVDVKCFALHSPRRLSATDNNSGIYQIRFAHRFGQIRLPGTKGAYWKACFWTSWKPAFYCLKHSRDGWASISLPGSAFVCSGRFVTSANFRCRC